MEYYKNFQATHRTRKDKHRNENERKQRTSNKRSDLSNNILMITLHVIDPNITIKKQEIFKVDFKNDPVIYCQQETHLL